MSCFVEGRDEDVVVADEGGSTVGSIGLGGSDVCDGDANGALSGESRNVVSVSGVNVR